MQCLSGGGTAGCHTLYQLVKRGVKAVLLERAKLSSGTTWQSAGILWRLRPDDVLIKLLNSTCDLLMQLETETGVDPGWVNNGGLFIASTKVCVQQQYVRPIYSLYTLCCMYHVVAVLLSVS